MNADISPEELKRAVDLLRSGKAPVRLSTPEQILQAVGLAIIDKAEARRLLGLKKRRQPKQLRRTKP